MKSCILVMMAAFLFSATTDAQAQTFAGGDGSEGDPWQIETPVQLAAMTNYTGDDSIGKHFILNNDIDLEDYLSNGNDGYNAGAFWDPMSSFKGDFDGGGHRILNLKINRPDKNHIGLFGHVSGDGVVRNVGVEVDPAGAIVGQGNVGTIIGYMSGGTMTNCYAIGDVSGDVDEWYAGGLIGVVVGGSFVADCYAGGNISGGNDIGGLIGRVNSSEIARCYSFSSPSGTTVGGLVSGQAGATNTANFWDTEASGLETSAMGAGKTTAEMKTAATFTDAGWDFVNVWDISSDSYPFLHSPQQDPAPGQTSVVEMGLLGTNGTEIASGETASVAKGTDFGGVLWNSALTNTFSITNSGDAELTITGVTTNGSQNSVFSIQNMPGSVATGGVEQFSVIFSPATIGVVTASVHIVNNSDVNPYILNVNGEGLIRDQTIDFPAIPDQRSTNNFMLEATADSGYTVHFEMVDGPAIITNDIPITARAGHGYWIRFTNTGVVSVRAYQNGDGHYWNAASTTNTFNVIDRTQNTDFGGEGVSDIAVYNALTGQWFAWSIGGGVVMWETEWGGSGFIPVPGDYDGDGRADLAVYHEETGCWYCRTVDGELVLWEQQWGGSDFAPVAGDFDGDGQYDLTVYHEETGYWYCWTVAGDLVMWEKQWGGPGFEPVTGDFSGNGISDLVVYHEETGYWYCWTVAGDLVMWEKQWGGPGYAPVPGDYDGDGCADLAVYHEETGWWFVMGADDDLLQWEKQWGGSGFAPVAGDYDGDGISDIAVYADGYWYVSDMDGELVLWETQWGEADSTPLGR